MRKFKVLAIDGGGAKGLYSATILSMLEERIQDEHGSAARLVDYFDLICGTSTGGLIALGLAARISTKEICSFYEVHGPRIFARSDSVWASVKQVCWGGKFSNEALQASLREMLGDRLMADSDCLLCIPTYNYTQGGYEVFKFDHVEGGLRRHNQVPMVDVALATSAAPTFFPLAQVKEEHDAQFVDGGVWANNPALVGLTEAMWHFVGKGKAYGNVELLSISSLNCGVGQPALLKKTRSFVKWAPTLFEIGLNAQSEFTDIFLKMLESKTDTPLVYLRVPSATISPHQQKLIRLDCATPSSFALMKQLARQMFFQMEKSSSLLSFVKERKTYFTKRVE